MGGMRRFGVLCFLLLFSCVDAFAKEIYTFGGMDHPWETTGTFQHLDLAAHPGSIVPEQLDPAENLARWIATRKVGRIWSSWGWSITGDFSVDRFGLKSLVDGDLETTYGRSFSEMDYNTFTLIEHPTFGTVFLDLGDVYGVRRVRLGEVAGVSRQATRDTDPIYGHLQRIEIGLNAGEAHTLDDRGWPFLQSIWNTDISVSESTEIVFPTRPVRYVGLYVDARGLEAFEAAEIEIYGEGYLPTALYESDILDFGDIANYGLLRWEGAKPGGAKVLVQTRTGSDDTPLVYWRYTNTEEERTSLSESGTPLTEEEYVALRDEDKAGVTYDTRHWSFWSAPYHFEEGRDPGVPVVSPHPRRYFQMKIDFANTFRTAGRLEEINLEYSSPPAARKIVAEIWPDDVQPAEEVMFIYALRPTINRGDTGFDTIRIETPVRPGPVQSVTVDRQEAEYTTREAEDPLRVEVILEERIDVTDDQAEIRIEFASAVLRYGTEFRGTVWDSRTDEVAQPVMAGDVSDDLPGDDLFVRTTLREELVVSLEAAPSSFTPNGDGINDETLISYDLLQLTAPARVKVGIYTLSGVRIREVCSGMESSGRYAHPWDGRNEDGHLVSPGVYVYRLSVDADTGTETRVGTVSVVY